MHSPDMLASIARHGWLPACGDFWRRDRRPGGHARRRHGARDRCRSRQSSGRRESAGRHERLGHPEPERPGSRPTLSGKSRATRRRRVSSRVATSRSGSASTRRRPIRSTSIASRWHGGLGGRLMQHVGPLNGTPGHVPVSDHRPDRMQLGGRYTLTTQTTWTSGIYLAVLKTPRNTTTSSSSPHATTLVSRRSFTSSRSRPTRPTTTGPTTARPERAARLQQLRRATVGGTHGAVKVSFDRPHQDNGRQ